jgi:hypothetical protein
MGVFKRGASPSFPYEGGGRVKMKLGWGML